MTARFKKHEKWIGKDLTLMVGGGDKKIKDHEILEGSQWAKFAGMGFLTQIKDSPASAPAPVSAPASVSAPVPAASSVATDGTTTKSSAGKVSMGDEKGKGKGKKEKEEPKADEVKSDTLPVTTTEPSDAPVLIAPSEDKLTDKLTD